MNPGDRVPAVSTSQISENISDRVPAVHKSNPYNEKISERERAMPKNRPYDQPVIGDRVNAMSSRPRRDSVREFFANTVNDIKIEKEYKSNTVNDIKVNKEYKTNASSNINPQKEYKTNTLPKNNPTIEYKTNSISNPNPYDSNNYKAPAIAKNNPYDSDNYKANSISENNPYDSNRYKSNTVKNNPYNSGEYANRQNVVNENPYQTGKYAGSSIDGVSGLINLQDDDYKKSNPYQTGKYAGSSIDGVSGLINLQDDDYKKSNPYQTGKYAGSSIDGVSGLINLDEQTLKKTNPVVDKYYETKQSSTDIYEPISENNEYKDAKLEVKIGETLKSNKVYSRDQIDRYNRFNRFGFLDPYNGLGTTREYLFFTKPNLNIMSLGGEEGKLAIGIADNTIFNDLLQRWPDVIPSLQSSYGTDEQKRNPFINLLSNSVRNTLDLPAIQAVEMDTAANIYGTSIPYRNSGYKSDENFDVSLEFEDTKFGDVYQFVRAYEEYSRIREIGKVAPPNIGHNGGILPIPNLSDKEKSKGNVEGLLFNRYLQYRELHDRISIFKIIVDEDMETILYWAKCIGAYINSVPRDSFSDLRESGGLKYTIEFKVPFIRDMDPIDLAGFNTLVTSFSGGNIGEQVPIYGKSAIGNGMVDGTWPKMPFIQRYSISDSNGSNWLYPKNMQYVYKLKWYGA